MQVKMVHADDWVAVYLDGKKVQEGHSVRVDLLLTCLGIEVLPTSGDYTEADMDAMGYGFPDALADLPEPKG